MELKQIKDMMAAMTRHGTKRLKIKQKDFELELERETAGYPDAQFTSSAALPSTARSGHDLPAFYAPPKASNSHPEISSLITVDSPMAGTFYISPAPEEPAFVKVGDQVSPDTVVCIIEAMKVMNEVKAGITGTIGAILVENGHPVEFGTKLFTVT